MSKKTNKSSEECSGEQWYLYEVESWVGGLAIRLFSNLNPKKCMTVFPFILEDTFLEQ
jgi:hypothetical protein